MTLTPDQTFALLMIGLVFIGMAVALSISSARTSWWMLEAQKLVELQQPNRQQQVQQKALVDALRDKVEETALFTRLSLEMGYTLPDAENDDTIQT